MRRSVSLGGNAASVARPRHLLGPGTGPGAWSPEDVSRPLAAGGTARGCRGRVRTFLSSLIDLLAEVFYLTGEDGEEFPVVVEFDRHVDGFGLQFEPAGGSPDGDVAALRVD